MKKEVVSLVFLILCLAGNAQKKSAIGFSFNLTDFKTPNALAGSTFQNAFQGNKWSNLRDHDAGFSLFYWGGLAPKINYSFRYNGTFGSGFPSAQSNLKNFYNEVEGSLHAFLLKPHVLV
ncbi:MAG: hypothetical protein KA160_07755, partial [Lacibacter sp.]|nr:hypothetical protein [Lacibacter sp.]